MALITMHEGSRNYIYKGMFNNSNTDIDRNIDFDVLYDNTDPNIYVEYNNIKFYNSAVLVYNNSFYFTIISETVGYFNFRQVYYGNTNYIYDITRAGNNAYTYADGIRYSATLNGVTIHYMDDRSNITIDSINGIPVFYDPLEYEDYVTNVAPPSYNWTSVPAISGKNGTVTLSTLNDINDGEAVNNALASAIDFSQSANVETLVNDNI